MNQTYINELKNHIGEEVTLKDRQYNSRSIINNNFCDKILLEQKYNE